MSASKMMSGIGTPSSSNNIERMVNLLSGLNVGGEPAISGSLATGETCH